MVFFALKWKVPAPPAAVDVVVIAVVIGDRSHADRQATRQ